MYKISEFSKLSQVSVKTLRYYDQLNLLKPAYTDKFTGYRYYSADQMFQIHRILAFKELIQATAPFFITNELEVPLV
ncbi:hypothetical protein AN161_04020 [Lysinibacillus sp. FJAT-14222]|nr:hypothetical protein AN161_04020 [Lysinibacillus sp. FJAT-14222]